MTRRVSLALGAGALGAWALTALAFAIDPVRAGAAYLFAFCTGFTATSGALLWLLIGHAANAKWFIVVRRFCEIAASALPLSIVLFLPIAVFRRQIYTWYEPARLDETARHYLAGKLSWLADPAFLIRSAVYLVALSLIAEVLLRLSRRQDRAGAEAALRLRRQLLRASCVLLPITGLLLTFAAFDWMMALDPAFYANVYGVYVASGAFMTAVALTALLAIGSGSRSRVSISADHLHALGRVAFASVCFWAYIAFVMVMLIWIADQPLEIRYLALRAQGGWQHLALVLVALHFVIPFFALLSRALKRNRRGLAAAGALLIVAHVIDVYFQVLPPFNRGRFAVHWSDAAALVAVTASLFGFAALRARRAELVPIGDPELARGMEYEAAS